MNRYTRQSPHDLAFRRVAIESSKVPDKFESFTSDSQTIEYRNGIVLEILRQDGSTALIYDGDRKLQCYTCEGKVISFFPEVPNARLWCRKRNGTGILYKVPSNLPQRDDGKCYFSVNGAASDIELCGDKYLSMVFNFQKI